MRLNAGTIDEIMKQIYQHPTLERLTQDEREEVWHAYREKHPNWSWSLTFFVLWALWLMPWMIAAQYINQNFVEKIVGQLSIHFILTILIGVVGGVILIGRVMLPKRMKEFHQFLDDKRGGSVISDLEIRQTNTVQGRDGNG